MVQPVLKCNLVLSSKHKVEQTDPVISLVGIYIRDTLACVMKKDGQIITEALFINSKKPNCSPKREWMD